FYLSERGSKPGYCGRRRTLQQICRQVHQQLRGRNLATARANTVQIRETLVDDGPGRVTCPPDRVTTRANAFQIGRREVVVGTDGRPQGPQPRIPASPAFTGRVFGERREQGGGKSDKT